VRALGIFISYNEQENDKKNVARKIQTMNIKLDFWRGRKLSLFGKCLIAKTLGISQIVYSASMLTSALLRCVFLVLFGTRNQIRSKEMLCARTIQIGDCGTLIQMFYSNICGLPGSQG